MSKDQIYKAPKDPVPPFEFDHQVVAVFDDMLNRSIPLYREMIRRQGQLIGQFYQDGTRIYDLGCSNGNLGMEVCRTMDQRSFQMIAVDNSEPMMEAFATRLASIPHGGQIDLLCNDIRQADISQASVVAMNFTLQFVDRGHRDAVVARIFNGLRNKGLLLLSEKIAHTNPMVGDLQQSMYYGFKNENGYSDLEISQKREALEKVLVPETLEDHLERLKWAGFRTVDVWLKWFNFAALIAVK